jgi:hypothetical protein
VLHEALDTLRCRGIDKHHEVKLRPGPCFRKKGNGVNEDPLRVITLGGAKTLSGKSLHNGVHNPLQVSACIIVRKNEIPQCPAIERTRGVNNPRAETFCNGLQGRRACSDSISRE